MIFIDTHTENPIVLGLKTDRDPEVIVSGEFLRKIVEGTETQYYQTLSGISTLNNATWTNGPCDPETFLKLSELFFKKDENYVVAVVSKTDRRLCLAQTPYRDISQLPIITEILDTISRRLDYAGIGNNHNKSGVIDAIDKAALLQELHNYEVGFAGGSVGYISRKPFPANPFGTDTSLRNCLLIDKPIGHMYGQWHIFSTNGEQCLNIYFTDTSESDKLRVIWEFLENRFIGYVHRLATELEAVSESM